MKLTEPDIETKFATRAQLLEAAGLLRSVVGASEQGAQFRYFTLSGAGLAELS